LSRDEPAASEAAHLSVERRGLYALVMQAPARLLRAVVVLPLAATLTAQDLQDFPGVREEARVERVVVDAYVTDPRGDPIPDLTAEDFRVRVDGKRIALESAEWIPADAPEALPIETDASGLPTLPVGRPRVELAPGRLLIFFFQTNYEPTRLVGLMRMGLQARRFLDGLLPTDRVAVLSFDSHLKLRQDFTNDRGLIEAAIDEAIRTGTSDAPIKLESPSLARHLDFIAAKKAVTPEKALALISRAVEKIPGGKSMLYFGWGLGTIGGLAGPNPKDVRDWKEAYPALASARISIFTLDVTDADYHTLEGTLMGVSDLTGGTYQKTHIFPTLAMDRVARAISGRYVLVFRKPDGKRGTHEIKVELVDHKGSVHARTYYED
jgi:VWFA-related protein